MKLYNLHIQLDHESYVQQIAFSITLEIMRIHDYIKFTSTITPQKPIELWIP